ncbi:MAG: tetratricopeptide (TPR) repeat protein [Chlamydiales bacterium]|jgi:tetratricopeptide (TPR) repeat protein
MTENETLREIHENKDFAKLKPFCEPSTWDPLSLKERERLGLLLVMWGEKLLKKGDNEALDILKLVSKAAPYSVDVLYRLGMCWYNYAKKRFNSKSLRQAEHAFKKVLQLNPFNFDASFHLANVHLYLGITHQTPELFRKAYEKYEKSLELCPEDVDPKKRADLMWQWGRCCCFLGKFSGEACDFREAISKFEQVNEENSPSPLFWNDYGNALVEMGSLISRVELFEKALGFYGKCVVRAPDLFEGWLNVACTAQKMYHFTLKNEYITKSHEAFVKASKIDSSNLSLWLKWGELFLTVGKIKRSRQWIKESLNKFQKADECEKEHPSVLNRWGEALLILGESSKDLKLLKEAEAKILNSLAVAPENPDTWYAYGTCLNELGGYFGHEEYYSDAVEKFQYGLSLNKNHPLLWYGLGMSYFSLAEVYEDVFLLERSIGCFAKVEELEVSFTQLWKDWGVALMKMCEATGEQEYIEAAIGTFEKNPHLANNGNVDIECLYHYGCAFDILGDFTDEEAHYERAVQVLSNVLTLDPSYSNARYNLALALSHMGEAGGSQECYQKANEYYHSIVLKDQEDEMAWNEWGLSLLNQAHLFFDDTDTDEFAVLCQDAENKLRHAAALGNLHSFYPLACLHSINGHYDAAMQFIERADHHDALPSMKDLMDDEWLDGLRTTERFRNFVSYLTSKTGEEDER